MNDGILLVHAFSKKTATAINFLTPSNLLFDQKSLNSMACLNQRMLKEKLAEQENNVKNVDLIHTKDLTPNETQDLSNKKKQ